MAVLPLTINPNDTCPEIFEFGADCRADSAVCTGHERNPSAKGVVRSRYTGQIAENAGARFGIPGKGFEPIRFKDHLAYLLIIALVTLRHRLGRRVRV